MQSDGVVGTPKTHHCEFTAAAVALPPDEAVVAAGNSVPPARPAPPAADQESQRRDGGEQAVRHQASEALNIPSATAAWVA